MLFRLLSKPQSYFKLTLFPQFQAPIQFAFPKDTTLGQAHLTIAQHKAFPTLQILKYSVIDDSRLQTLLLSEQDNLADLAKQSELEFKLANATCQYTIEGNSSYVDDVVEQAISLGMTRFGAANVAEVVRNGDLKDIVISKIKRLQEVYVERKKIQQLKEYEFKKEQQKSINKSLKFARTLLGLSIGQFIGLFYITYGLYGWDVGQPISYLSGLSLDLAIVVMLIRGMPYTRESILQRNMVLNGVEPPYRLRQRVYELEESMNRLSLKQ